MAEWTIAPDAWVTIFSIGYKTTLAIFGTLVFGLRFFMLSNVFHQVNMMNSVLEVFRVHF